MMLDQVRFIASKQLEKTQKGSAMCLEVFVAADEPLPTIPFNSAAPAFNASTLWPTAESVRRHFSKPHVYSLGAQTGCACGFYYSPDDVDPDFFNAPNVPEEVKEIVRADYAAGREAVRQLKRYLTFAVGRSGLAEVFSCWIGDETAEPVSRRTVTLDYFDGEAFRFVEKEFLTVLFGGA
jgi:hypothetical protein